MSEFTLAGFKGQLTDIAGYMELEEIDADFILLNLLSYEDVGNWLKSHKIELYTIFTVLQTNLEDRGIALKLEIPIEKQLIELFKKQAEAGEEWKNIEQGKTERPKVKFNKICLAAMNLEAGRALMNEISEPTPLMLFRAILETSCLHPSMINQVFNDLGLTFGDMKGPRKEVYRPWIKIAEGQNDWQRWIDGVQRQSISALNADARQGPSGVG
jgi:hypothetical protein